jgi:hypothetical protein
MGAWMLLACMPAAVLAENPGEIFIDPGAGSLPRTTPSSDKRQGEERSPGMKWEMLMVLENTRLSNIKSDHAQVPFSQVNYLDPIVQHALEFRLTPNLGIYALSQVKSFAPGGRNRAFAGLDAQLLNLFLAYEDERKEHTFFGGKFDVGFGEGWHRLDGIYSGFSEDYHYQGVLGAGARQTWQNGWGKTALTEIVFKRDQSVMRDTWFAEHEETREASDENGLGAGPGLRSGGISFEASDLDGIDGLRLGIDAGHVAQAYPGRRGMNVAAGTVEYRKPLAADTELRMYAEFVHARGFDGKQLRAAHATLSASLSRGNFIWTVTAARRSFSAISGDLAAQGIVASRDRGISAALTYVTSMGMVLQAGIARQHAQGLAVTQATVRAIYHWKPQ